VQEDPQEKQRPLLWHNRPASRYGPKVKKGKKFGDEKAFITFLEANMKTVIIDVTVADSHAVSDHTHTINEDKYSDGLADHGAHLKDQKHRH
jgi:hypothetical protein